MVINGKKIVVKHKTLGFSGRHSWTVYPVTYHDNRYVVELSFSYGKELYHMPAEFRVKCYIHTYSEKRLLFRQHKKSQVWCGMISTFVKLGNNAYLSLRNLDDNDFLLHLPEILKDIFRQYANYEYEQKKSRDAFTSTESWDGVIR